MACDNGALSHALCYQGASVISTVLFYPVDLCKVRVMSQSSLVRSLRDYKVLLQPRRKVLSGLYYSILASTVSSATYMFLYQTFAEKLVPTNQPLEILYVVSLGASCISAVLTNPLWLLKIRMQLDDCARACSKGTLARLRTVVRTDGFRGLFRGLQPQLLGIFVHSAYFPLYTTMKNLELYKHSRDSRNVSHCLQASIFSKIILSTISNPLQILHVHLQSTMHRRSGSMLGVIDAIKVRDGLLQGLFLRGLAYNLLFEIPRSSTRIVLYEIFMRSIYAP